MSKSAKLVSRAFNLSVRRNPAVRISAQLPRDDWIFSRNQHPLRPPQTARLSALAHEQALEETRPGSDGITSGTERNTDLQRDCLTAIGTLQSLATEHDFRDVLPVVERLKASATLNIKPTLAAELIHLTTKHHGRVESGFAAANKTKHLFWHLVKNKNKYLSDHDIRSNSTHFCSAFTVALRANLQMRYYTAAFEMAEAMLNLAFAQDSKVQLLTPAANILLRFYAEVKHPKRALYLFDYMVEAGVKGNRLACPDIRSITSILQCCDGDQAIRLLADMTELAEHDSLGIFPTPDHTCASMVLSWLRKPHPTAGSRVEDFLMWCLSCHGKGSMDLSKINMRAAMAQVMEAWSISLSPDAGPRSDLLLQRVIDQYMHGGRQHEEAPDPMCFAYNAAAWVRTHLFHARNGGAVEPLDVKLQTVLDHMETFGTQEHWSRETFIKLCRRVEGVLRLERAKSSEVESSLAMLLSYCEKRGVTLERSNPNKTTQSDASPNVKDNSQAERVAQAKPDADQARNGKPDAERVVRAKPDAERDTVQAQNESTEKSTQFTQSESTSSLDEREILLTFEVGTMKVLLRKADNNQGTASLNTDGRSAVMDLNNFSGRLDVRLADAEE